MDCSPPGSSVQGIVQARILEWVAHNHDVWWKNGHFPGGKEVVNKSLTSAEDVRDLGSIPGLGRSPGDGHGNPLQYSCLENPMDRGAW